MKIYDKIKEEMEKINREESWLYEHYYELHEQFAVEKEYEATTKAMISTIMSPLEYITKESSNE